MPQVDENDVRVGVDIGGTFTDIIAFDPVAETVRIEKVPSTPSNPANGVIDGLEALFDRTRIVPGDVTMLSHGSTVTINALIEHAGAQTGLLVTEGFTGVPLARHGEKPPGQVKNPRYQQPEPYVPQNRVREVPERIDAEGTVLKSLDEAATRDAVATLRDEGVESIAVCLLFSFLNPEHERRVREIVEEVHPECAVTLSSEVAPRIREYPRLSTTTISAYVDPILTAYLADLEQMLAERDVAPDVLTMMLSHGGLTTFPAAADEPASTVLSGPAAGVQGALFTARLTGDRNVVTMDMGGTSCDIAIAPDREPVTTTEKEIEQNPVSVPLIDVQAIGAGGGTIARVESGRLRVGPDSAGADPGPVCYGKGGQRATITDANAVLGRLSPESKLAGDISVDVQAAADAIRERIGEPLDLSVTEAAAGILEVVNNKMKKELSLALTKQGFDPREFSLVVYGGAGPMHAPAIANELHIERVVVPPRPGINSAVGLLTTDRRRLYERSRVDSLEEAPIDSTFQNLESEATEDIAETDVPADAISFERELEMRYAGQPYELTIPLAECGDRSPASLRAAFDERHREAYGHVSDQSVETMTYRVVSTVTTDKLTEASLVDHEDASDTATERTTREVYFQGARHATPIYRRETLGPGATFQGPAIVEQSDTTVVVEPDMAARVDTYGNLVITEDAV